MLPERSIMDRIDSEINCILNESRSRRLVAVQPVPSRPEHDAGQSEPSRPDVFDLRHEQGLTRALPVRHSPVRAEGGTVV